jgi:hypothetical protein
MVNRRKVVLFTLLLLENSATAGHLALWLAL